MRGRVRPVAREIQAATSCEVVGKVEARDESALKASVCAPLGSAFEHMFCYPTVQDVRNKDYNPPSCRCDLRNCLLRRLVHQQ
jgi:hypothetical protein